MVTQPTVADIHSQGRSSRELMIHCHGCGETSHYFVFSADYDTWNEPEKIYVSIYVGDEYRRPSGWFQRLKAAWTIFKQGDYHRSETGLDRKDLEDIRDFAINVLAVGDANGQAIDPS